METIYHIRFILSRFGTRTGEGMRHWQKITHTSMYVSLKLIYRYMVVRYRDV